MRISVIIIAHNKKAVIAQSIKSAQSQTVKSELIVVAYACTDTTAIVAKELGAVVLSSPSTSTSVAKKIAVHKATGEVLLFLQAGCVLRADTLEHIVRAVEQGYDHGSIIMWPLDDHGLLAKLVCVRKHVLSSLEKNHIAYAEAYFCKKSAYVLFAEQKNDSKVSVNHVIGSPSFLMEKKKFTVLSDTCVFVPMQRYKKIGYLRALFGWQV